MKKVFAYFLALTMLLALTACSDTDVPDTSSEPDSSSAVETAEDGSWAVYWYLCGSDLETNYGCASTDIAEMMEVQLPENVNVVIQTGGAAVWQNEYMDPSKIQRWLYNSEGLHLLEEQDIVNMGVA